MTSLKLFAPVLAELTGLSAVAIYERQRALIRFGVLPTPTGRGRGNGLPATPGYVAWLLIAVMLTDSLSDTDIRVRKWGNARLSSSSEKVCDLTKRRTFHAALASLLASRKHSAAVQYVELSRVSAFAAITFAVDQGFEVSQFGTPIFERLNFEVAAKVSGYVFREIAAALEHAAKIRG